MQDPGARNGFWWRALSPVVHARRVAVASAQKFVSDDCLSSASVIAYSLVVSLVPLLTVGFSLFTAFSGIGTRKQELFGQAERFLREHGANIDIRPFISAIDSLTSNAASVGGVGLLVLIFSATAILRTLEHSFNAIWKISKERSVLRQVVFYWAALTLGPVVLATGVSLAGVLRKTFSQPTLREARLIGERIWMIGDQGAILTADRKLAKVQPLVLRNVDLGRQELLFAQADTEEGTGLLKHVPEKDRSLVEVTEGSLRKINLRAVFHLEKRIWLLAEDGTIIYSQNSGTRWKVMRLLTTGISQKYDGVSLTDITFVNEKTGFIVAKQGILLRTVDGGLNWTRLSTSRYTGVRGDVSAADDIHKIAFRNALEGLAVCSRGTFLVTTDGGSTWTKKGVAQARVDRNYADLLDVSFNESGEPWVAGGLGMVLFSQANFKDWKARSASDTTARRALSAGRGRLVVLGEADRVLFSRDAGRRWQHSQLGAPSVTSVAIIDGRAIAVGENLGIYESGSLDEEQIKWQRKHGGTDVALRTVRVVLPFAAIWVIFTAVFIALPNTRVRLLPAAIGAAVASGAWVLFIQAFMLYVRYFSGGTQAIYGALAAIPLFLLLLYCSAVILMYGAVLTCVIQNARVYLHDHPAETAEQKASLYPGVRILAEIFGDFEAGRSPTKTSALLRFADNEAQLAHLLETLNEGGLITPPMEGTWIPLRAARLVNLEEVVQLLERSSLEVTGATVGDAVAAHVRRSFAEAQKARAERFSKVTLADLVAGR